MVKLLRYSFEIIYKLGHENRDVDALSKSMEEGELRSMAYFLIIINFEVHLDEKLKKIIAEVKNGSSSSPYICL